MIEKGADLQSSESGCRTTIQSDDPAQQQRDQQQTAKAGSNFHSLLMPTAVVELSADSVAAVGEPYVKETYVREPYLREQYVAEDSTNFENLKKLQISNSGVSVAIMAAKDLLRQQKPSSVSSMMLGGGVKMPGDDDEADELQSSDDSSYDPANNTNINNSNSNSTVANANASSNTSSTNLLYQYKLASKLVSNEKQSTPICAPKFDFEQILNDQSGDNHNAVNAEIVRDERDSSSAENVPITDQLKATETIAVPVIVDFEVSKEKKAQSDNDSSSSSGNSSEDSGDEDEKRDEEDDDMDEEEDVRDEEAGTSSEEAPNQNSLLTNNGLNPTPTLSLQPIRASQSKAGKPSEDKKTQQINTMATKKQMNNTKNDSNNIERLMQQKKSRNSGKSDDSSSSSSSDDDDDSEEDITESHINMREKLRNATAQIDKIPPTIEEMEAGEHLDLSELQRMILKDKELTVGGKGFEDEDDEDEEECDYEEEQLNQMMRERFNRQKNDGRNNSGRTRDFLFEADEDEMQGFEDLEDELEDHASESLIRQQIFRSNNIMDDDDMEDDDDTLLSWSGRHMGGEDSDDENDDESISMDAEIKKSLTQAGIGQGPKGSSNRLFNSLGSSRSNQFSSFQVKPLQRYQKALPKPTKDNLEDICEIMRNNVIPHKKMQILNALREGKYAYFGELLTIFIELDSKSDEQKQLGQDPRGTLNYDRLNKFAQLVKQLILLCDPQTVEILMSEKFYMMSFGGLELLPEFKGRLDCRDFFRKTDFRQVIPLKNERLLMKIQLYYRVNFLKESIFPNQDGQIQQTLACICINNMIDLLKELLMNVDYLRRIAHEAVSSPEIQLQNDAVQFFVEIVQQFKNYQNYLTGLGQLSKSVHEVLLKQIDSLQMVKNFFLKDERVISMHHKDLAAQEGGSFSPEESKVQERDGIDYLQPHHRYTDKGCFDVILTQLIEMINLLLQTNNKELIVEFLKDEELAKVLGVHIFYAPEEALRSQIVELFKSILDLSQFREIQIKVEKVIIDAILKPFFAKLSQFRTRSIQSDNEGNIEQIYVEKSFRNQSQLIFELVQLMLKPLINALIQDQRKDVTEIMVKYFCEYNMARLSLGVFSEEENDLLTRLMGLKLFKSLFVLTAQSKEITKIIVSSHPISFCVPQLKKFSENPKRPLNMLDSAMFEMINQYGALLYDKVGSEMHSKVVTQYVSQFPNLKSLLDKFICPDGLKKYRQQQELAKQNQESFGQNPKFRDFLAKKRSGQGSMIANRIAAQINMKNQKASAAQLARQEIIQKAGFRFRDLVLRSYKDEKELDIIQQQIGQKRTREDNNDDSDDLFSVQQKRKRQAMFKFASKQGEKLPQQPNAADNNILQWSDSDDEEQKEQCNEESKKAQGGGLLTFYIGAGSTAKSIAQQQNGFVRASSLQSSQLLLNGQNNAQGDCLLELSNNHYQDDDEMRQSQEELLLDPSCLLQQPQSPRSIYSNNDSSDDENDIGEQSFLPLQPSLAASGNHKEHLEIEVDIVSPPVLSTKSNIIGGLPTFASHLVSLGQAADPLHQHHHKIQNQLFFHSKQETEQLQRKFENCKINLFPPSSTTDKSNQQ